MAVVVNMACGLANRMFQYSYYLFLKSKGYQVKVDFLAEKKLAHEEVMWNRIFPKALFSQSSKEEVQRLGGGLDLLSKIRRKCFPFWSHVFEMPGAFDTLLPRKDKDQYVIGVFQNAQMVETVKSDIIEHFEFLPFTDSINIQRVEEFQKCESVAIHIRKGDDYQKRFLYQNTCPMEYYRKAINWMKKNLNNPVFYVFTDNPDWVKQHFVDFEYKLVEGNPESGWGSHFDMQLMSNCKHVIISNSTYSWWGAFLNKNTNKKVIVPKIWFNPKSCEEYTSERILCQDWIAL